MYVCVGGLIGVEHKSVGSFHLHVDSQGQTPDSRVLSEGLRPLSRLSGLTLNLWSSSSCLISQALACVRATLGLSCAGGWSSTGNSSQAVVLSSAPSPANFSWCYKSSFYLLSVGERKGGRRTALRGWLCCLLYTCALRKERDSTRGSKILIIHHVSGSPIGAGLQDEDSQKSHTFVARLRLKFHQSEVRD